MNDHKLHSVRGRKVRLKVIAVKSERGRCPNGHRVGDEYVVGGHTVKGICIGAFGACLPYLTTLRWGGSFPWEEDPESLTVGCPDCENQVVWRLKTE
ncbi:MAG: TIGR04076 family protein [Myxococcota bacterium]|nr:TIGR04076 family protein [Myxococcota bacterium]